MSEEQMKMGSHMDEPIITELTDSHKLKLMSSLKAVINDIITTEAQDVLIVEDEKIEVKIKGVLTVSEHLVPWTREDFNYFLGSVSYELPKNYKGPRGQGYLHNSVCIDLLNEGGMSHDFNLSLGDKISLRVHLYSVYQAKAPSKQGLALAIRVVKREIPSWDTLNLPAFFRNVWKQKSGLVLVAGHVGSGKSTTVASLVKDINLMSSSRQSVITIEHPIEYIHQSSSAKILQKGVGINTPSFSEATDDALRENVDVIVIGELRDQEEMDNALRLAEVGKLVFATIHSNSVVDTPDRFINMFPGDIQDNIRERLAANVICILHQNLENYEGKQYPSVEGFYARNAAERDIVKRAFKSRKDILAMMDDGKNAFVKTKKDTFEELTNKVTFENLDGARETFTK